MADDSSKTATDKYQRAEGLVETCDYDDAIELYKQAAVCFKDNLDHENSNKCMIKVADLYVLIYEKYDEAIEIYEKYIINDNFNFDEEIIIKIVLSKLIIYDIAGSTSFLNMCSDFAGLNDDLSSFSFIHAIIATIQNNNVDDFTDAVSNYGSHKKMESWKVSLFLKIKQHVGMEQNTQPSIKFANKKD